MTAIGELITPTGVLVLPPERLGGEEWLDSRRWRPPIDQGTRLDHDDLTESQWKRLGYRIGSSDVPSILDLDGADTPAHVYRAKMYDIRPEVNEAMSWGHLNEPAIALEWCRRNRAVIDETGLVAKADEPWRQSTIDRRVRQCPVSREHEECLLEVKNVDAHVAMRWHAEIPDRIYAQIIDQLDVTGYGHAHYACLIGGNRMKQGIVWADREVKIRDFIRAKVRAFRTEHLLARVEPPWDVSRKPDKMIALDEATHPERVGTLDIEGIGDVMHYAQMAAEKSAAETARKAAAARLRQLADGKEFVTFAGEPAYRFGESELTNVDLDKLKELYPDVYEDPRVVTHKKSHTIYVDKACKVKKGDRG
jgi:predicted phage-related endonuclease